MVVGNEARTYLPGRAKSTRAEEYPLKSLFRRKPRPSAPAGERIYAIGDVHGRADLLDALLDRIEEDSAARGESADVIVLLLGDLVDRGPESARAVETARSWSRGFAKLEALLGNHEATMLTVLRGHDDWLDSWLAFGGRQTLVSYGVPSGLLSIGTSDEIIAAAQHVVPEAHLAWFERLPHQLRHGDYLFVHAGIRPGVDFDAQQPRDMLWIREEFLNSTADHGAVVVHGHSIAPEIEDKPNRIGIDTGAFMTDRLSAVGLEGEARWFLQT